MKPNYLINQLYFVIILISCLCMSCKKDKVTSLTSVHGRLLDLKSKIGIFGAKVFVFRHYYPFLVAGGALETIDSATTNTNGEYEMQFTAKTNDEYYVYTAQDYIPYLYSFVSSSNTTLTLSTSNVVNFNFNPLSRIRVHVKNNSYLNKKFFYIEIDTAGVYSGSYKRYGFDKPDHMFTDTTFYYLIPAFSGINVISTFYNSATDSIKRTKSFYIPYTDTTLVITNP